MRMASLLKWVGEVKKDQNPEIYAFLGVLANVWKHQPPHCTVNFCFKFCLLLINRIIKGNENIWTKCLPSCCCSYTLQVPAITLKVLWFFFEYSEHLFCIFFLKLSAKQSSLSFLGSLSWACYAQLWISHQLCSTCLHTVVYFILQMMIHHFAEDDTCSLWTDVFSPYQRLLLSVETVWKKRHRKTLEHCPLQSKIDPFNIVFLTHKNMFNWPLQFSLFSVS